MTSPEIWYRSNRLAAIYLLLAAIISAAFWFASKHWIQAPKTRVWVSVVVFTGLLLFTVVATQVQTLRWVQNRHTIQEK